MRSNIEAVLPQGLMLQATIPDSPRAKPRIYVVVNPEYRSPGGSNEDPQVLLGRLGREEPYYVDRGILRSQDEVLKAILLKELIDGVKLTPIDKDMELKGLQRVRRDWLGGVSRSLRKAKVFILGMDVV